MIDHCAYCVHRADATNGPNCSYEVDGCDFHKERRPCRELTEHGATYRCFKLDREMQMADWSYEIARLESVDDTILEALDKLEWRVEKIEDGLRMATKR